jgi:hypothetical protein
MSSQGISKPLYAQRLIICQASEISGVNSSNLQPHKPRELTGHRKIGVRGCHICSDEAAQQARLADQLRSLGAWIARCWQRLPRRRIDILEFGELVKAISEDQAGKQTCARATKFRVTGRWLSGDSALCRTALSRGKALMVCAAVRPTHLQPSSGLT